MTSLPYATNYNADDTWMGDPHVWMVETANCEETKQFICESGMHQSKHITQIITMLTRHILQCKKTYFPTTWCSYIFLM